jgi:hypothetical protein
MNPMYLLCPALFKHSAKQGAAEAGTGGMPTAHVVPTLLPECEAAAATENQAAMPAALHMYVVFYESSRY